MFLEIEIINTNNRKRIVLINGDSYPDLEKKFTNLVKKYSKDINIVKIKYTKSDCFKIKNEFCEALEVILKKNFSTSP